MAEFLGTELDVWVMATLVSLVVSLVVGSVAGVTYSTIGNWRKSPKKQPGIADFICLSLREFPGEWRLYSDSITHVSGLVVELPGIWRVCVTHNCYRFELGVLDNRRVMAEFQEWNKRHIELMFLAAKKVPTD